MGCWLLLQSLNKDKRFIIFSSAGLHTRDKITYKEGVRKSSINELKNKFESYVFVEFPGLDCKLVQSLAMYLSANMLWL